ncbi:MAG: sulfatase-like hydrolase/transferase [Verrucomicrobiota bacterium]
MKSLLITALALLSTGSLSAKQPNILWIVTDDHRPDSISAYNRAVYGTDESPLGYVESPNVDKLAAEGVLFTRAMCNSPACGPSRGSMHSGRYPFRNGHYEFELSHQAPDFVKPAVAQVMRGAGYTTAAFGKHDHYIYRWGPGQGFHDAGFFDTKIHFKHDLQKNGIGDLYTAVAFGEVNGLTETVLYPDGTKRKYFLRRQGAELTDKDRAGMAQTDKEFDILRSYTRNNPTLIIGGENPQPAADTVDAGIVAEMKRYLENAGEDYKTPWGKAMKGADPAKPQFIHLGFHLPHTPVLPPKSFRDRFKTKKYEVPYFSKDELDKLPPQLVRLYNACKFDGMTDEEKQVAIQDYYAFCAHGDALIGDAVESFKQYCKANGQEYLILFTIGDHGWHLGEQGIEAKFGPWQQSVANAAIIVSSDKKLVPAGKQHDGMVEFVDFAPTLMDAGGVALDKEDFDYLDGYSLFDVLDGSAPKRDYILGEIHLVAGPRAYLHTDRFRFSMTTRPFPSLQAPGRIGKNIEWALKAPVEKVSLALYDLEKDPLECNNVADDPKYRKLAAFFRDKLGRIVLGDGRIECDWTKENEFVRSDFAKGADDKKLEIPAELIP